MGTSFRIGRVFGIDVGVHWSWIFIFAIVTWSFATGVLDHFYPQWSDARRWIIGGLVAGVFFLSILAHELSHALVSNANRLPVRSITLFVFGGVANLTKEPPTAGLEFKIAIVGPLTSLALGAMFAAGWAALRPLNDGVAGISANLALINGSLAVFNMLPGFPLDGGRVFRSIIWSRNNDRLRATRIASRVGEWIAYGIMGIGVVYTFFGSVFSGVWFLLIGFFLRNASSASYEQLLAESTLSGATVGDVMQRDVQQVAPDVSLYDLVHDYVLQRNARCFAVLGGGRFLGLISLTDARNRPKEEWATTTVYRAMTPANRLQTASPDDGIMNALRLMAMHDVHQLPVMRGNDVVGMVTRGEIMRFMQLRQDVAEAGAMPAGAHAAVREEEVRR